MTSAPFTSRFRGLPRLLAGAFVATAFAMAPSLRAAEPVDDFSPSDKGCAKEISTLCKAVKPGNSQLSDCLVKNKEQLGGECRMSVSKYLKTRFETACTNDGEKLCPAEKKLGSKPLMECLKTKGETLSSSCAKVLNIPQKAGGTPAPAAAPADKPAEAPKSNRHPLEGFFLPPVK